MAHLFLETAEGWIAIPLDGGENPLTEGELRSPRRSRESLPDSPPVIVRHRIAGRGDDEWVLLAPPGARIRVNGIDGAMGIRVLRDRDEILIGGAVRIFFSTEERPAIVPFPETTGTIYCARCRQAIVPGTPAVRCGCGLWHHESTELPCWSYADRCSGCPAPTALDGGYRWTPEEL